MNAPAGTAAQGEPRIIVTDDAGAGAAVAAGLLADSIAAAVAARGRADVATTGGSTAPALYRALLAPAVRERIAWDRLHVWWGDDRFVPRGDADSNVTPLDAILIAGDPALGLPGAPLPAGNIHPVPIDAALAAGRGPAWAAAAYGSEIGAALPVRAGLPAFDAVILGVGPDGHCLSVFPGSAACDADPRVTVLAVEAPTHVAPHLPRVTINPALLEVAGEVLVVAFGSGKAAVLAQLLGPVRDPRALPAQRGRRRGATWILDRAAAAQLPAGVRDGWTAGAGG